MKSRIRAYNERLRNASILVTLIILSVIVAFSGFVIYNVTPNPTANQDVGHQNTGQLKAALIDALYATEPNHLFTDTLVETLHNEGFTIDIYQGETVTVDLLKNLPSGYKLLILRMHSALDKNNELYLFTGEPYIKEKYTGEQYFRLVKEAYATNESQSVFAINWGFVKRCMTTKFNEALVIAMGCHAARDPTIYNEFFNRGATAYVGWDGDVTLFHSDKATLHLIQTLYTEELTLEQAIEKTTEQIGPDPSYDSMLKCYYAQT